MRLSHLLVMVVPVSFCSGLSVTLLLGAGIPISERQLLWFTVPAAVFAGLAIAGPLSRLLGLSPLMIFAGPCPACHTRPSGWWAMESQPRRLILACGGCGAQLDLWLTRKRPADVRSQQRYVFVLRWPQFLGIWRRVQ